VAIAKRLSIPEKKSKANQICMSDMRFIEMHASMGRGFSYIDGHLLA
jgi:hypothetical protein